MTNPIRLLGAGIAVALCLWGCPKYVSHIRSIEDTYFLARDHRKAVEKAESDAAEIKNEIAEAKARKEIELLKAKNTVEVMKIIANGLKGNEAYLEYLRAQNCEDAKK